MRLIDEGVELIPLVATIILGGITKGSPIQTPIIHLGLITTVAVFFLHRDVVKGWYKAREEGKFCKSCGAPTYITKIRRGYDPKTGKPILEDYRSCPNIRYGYDVDSHPLSYDF